MDFDTYVLVAYSTAGGRSAGNMAAGYWVQGITEEQEAEEELQFYEAAAFFLETYPHKTFVFTNCEGDWEIRGGLGVQRAPHEAAFASMARWLQARQAGVTRARQRHRMPGAAGNVYLAGEVNLVAESLFEGKPNVVNRVLPFVQLDMVSYSSYDTQQDLREFEAALRYLASQHNRSAWSPNGMSALMLGEFGLPQSKMTLPDITYILGNVINSALAMGVSYILFWETFCNECLPGPGCGADGRCREKVPVTEVDRLNGFWLVWPDGTKAWPWRYLHQKLHEAPESELWALRREREDETGALYGRSTLALLGSAAVAVASIFRYCRVHRRIQFVEAKDVHLRINIFHCCFYDAEADQPMLPREETELKRNIFEVPRRLKHQQAIEDALGVTTLEFGGDCAAGLCHEKQPPGPSELSIEDLVIDDLDRYEVQLDKDWLPCVVRAANNDEILLDLYSPGSFFCENLGHWGPKTATLSQLRFRQWEVCRGEVLRIPERQVMTLRQGQHLWIQSRGPGNDEPAGRLEMSEGSSLRCLGGTVENEGVLMCIIAVPSQHGLRRYKLEIESTKTVLVDCVKGIPELPAEERSVALQCFTWIFERAYRQMQLRTLGGRGWYLADEGRALSLGSDLSLSPRVFLYKGFVATTAYVSAGPCLKVDISVRLIQSQTALARLNFFRDLLFRHHKEHGLPVPTKAEMDAFLQKRMAGRTCMSRHNQIHYRIQKVCIDMDPLATFPFEEGEITYLEYFQRRHGLTLQKKQPMLYCPFRTKQQVYLPAEIAFLTGLDEEWRRDKDFSWELWQSLRHTPQEHWRLQERLMKGLDQPDHGRALREWGVKVASTPMKVNFGELPQEPVYFSPLAEEHFRELRLPPSDLEVPSWPDGFEQRPWPEIWTRPGEKIALDRWLIFVAVNEQDLVEEFIEEIEPMVGELLDAGKDLRISRPTVVAVSATSANAWVKKLAAYQPPWEKELTDFVLVALPQVRRRDQYYYLLKNLLTFHWDHCCPSQMILSSTLQRDTQRCQVWRCILQQILVKKGAFLWVINPLPYLGRTMMVVGLDTAKAGKDAPLLVALSASCNVYFTSYFSTWRIMSEATASPAPLMEEALRHFLQKMRRLPDTVVIYRGGVSDSQQEVILEHEMHHPTEGILAAFDRLAEVEGQEPWRSKVSVAYIMVRRSMNIRFMTEEGDNLPSGSYIDEDVIPGLDADNPVRSDFYMISQTYVRGTARPTLYTVLYNTLNFSKMETMQLTYRLCGVYMTFAGKVSTPAPLKYVAKLLSLLSKCNYVPREPTGQLRLWRPNLFFV
ncbi:unnamed protein product [Durusdinium trenchii]